MQGESSSAFLVFLIIVLIIGFGSFLFGDFNNRFTRVFRQASIWTLIFLGAVLLFSFRDDIETALFSSGSVAVEGTAIVLTRAGDGHFYADVEINGVEINFVVDTGASQIVLSQEDAEKAGIDMDRLRYVARAFTANGEVRTAPVRLDSLQLGARIDRGLQASVNGGELRTSLLGMTYLNRFSKIELIAGKMRLVP